MRSVWAGIVPPTRFFCWWAMPLCFASHAQGPWTTMLKQGCRTILAALLCYEQSIVTAWMGILVQLGTLCYGLSSSPSHMNLLRHISWWLMHGAFNSFGGSWFWLRGVYILWLGYSNCNICCEFSPQFLYHRSFLISCLCNCYLFKCKICLSLFL